MAMFDTQMGMQRQRNMQQSQYGSQRDLGMSTAMGMQRGSQPQQFDADPMYGSAQRQRNPSQGGFGGFNDNYGTQARTSMMGAQPQYNSYGQPPPGPYGQQPTYNPQQNNQLGDFLNKFQGRNWGDWNIDKVAAGNQAYTNAFGIPYIQALQNDRTQQFNENSWQANFGEQQYLNRNQVGLDWQASSREDMGLDYAMRSGDRQFTEGARQFDVTSGNQRYGLETDRFSQQSTDRYNQGQLRLGEQQNMTADRRQRADQLFQQGQLGNDRTRMQNEREIALRAQAIDDMYKRGLIGVEQRNAEIADMRARNEYELGRGQNDNVRQRNLNDLELGRGGLEQQRYASDIERELGMGRNANERYATDISRELGLANVGADRYRSDQELQGRLADVGAQRYRSELERESALANVAAQRYGVDVQALSARERNSLERELGLADIGVRNRATDVERELGLGRNATEQYGAETGRMQVQNQNQIAQQQLQLEQMLGTGRLSIDEYQAATSRLQQQSQQSQWQQQLEAEQSQFGQTLAFQREQLAQDRLNMRYQNFGRAAQPNMAAYSRSWY